MAAVRISSPGDLAQFLRLHGEEEGHSVRFRNSFSLPLSDVPGIVATLESKLELKGWRVDAVVYLRPLIEVDDAHNEAEELLGDLIALTKPVPVGGSLHRSGRHVGLPLRIIGLGATAGPRRNGHANLAIGASVPAVDRSSASGPLGNGRADLPIGLSVAADGRASASGLRRNGRANLAIGASVPVDAHASASGPHRNGRDNIAIGSSVPVDGHVSASGSSRSGRAALTIGSSVPVDGHSSASGSRRANLAIGSYVPVDSHSFASGSRSSGRANLVIGSSVPIDGRGSTSGSRRSGRAALSIGPSIRYVKSRRAGRRHRLPRIVPAGKAKELLEAGNRLQGCHLLQVQEVGEAVSAVGLSLLRQNKDRATLHAHLVRVKDQLVDARIGEVRFGDLK